MSIKLALLKSGENVIADIKELISEEKVCGYLFTKPHYISTRKTPLLTEEKESSNTSNLEVSFEPWIILAKDKKIPVRMDWVVTIVEPLDSVIKMYEEKVNGQQSETDQDNSSDEPTTLIE